MLKFIGERAFKNTGTLLFLLVFCLPPDALAQSIPDSIISSYDSIQDVRRRRWESGLDSRLHGLDTSIRNNTASVDTALLLMKVMREGINHLQERQKYQEQQIDSLTVQLRQARGSAAAYRANLHRNLWIAAIVFLFLLVVSFTYLMFRSLRTRELIRKIRWKLRKDRKKLVNRIDLQDRRMKKKIKSIRKSPSRKK